MPKLLPYMHVENFLGNELSRQVLAYAVASEDQYTPSRVWAKRDEDEVDARVRISRVLRDLGPFDGLLQQKIRDFIPEMLAGLGVSRFQPRDKIELELAAHGDGAFYKPHIDMRLGETADRVLSAVYYMHGAPKVFSGGGLRIFPMPAMPGNDLPVVVAPTHDSLLVFQSYVRHEVMPIVCPGAAFKDYRFAVNCWIHKANA